MKNERDIINDLKPLRPQIPSERYFYQLADRAIKQKNQLTTKRNNRLLYIVASLAACLLLFVWLLPSSESKFSKAALLKIEAGVSPLVKNNYSPSKTAKTVHGILKNEKPRNQAPQNDKRTIMDQELDFSSLSQEEILTFLEEEEVDLLELEDYVHGND